MNVRAVLGGFLPSSGVGTGYRRDALERLARANSNRIFEPESLTEDYENGLRLFRLGCSQAFVPITRGAGRDFMATREFFPGTWRSALRQRTRWVTGIALQGWERLGWSGKPGEVYWLWRDRKGLIGNPLSLAANLVFLYGLATSLWNRASPITVRLAAATLALQLLRTCVRAGCVARIYGPWFALGVPVRMFYANALNTAATFQALARYAVARARHQPLKWLKTDHAYPTRAILLAHKRRLGEILVGEGFLPASDLAAALIECPQGIRLGEYLIGAGRIAEDRLYEALGFQQGLPIALIDPQAVPWRVAHALPEQVVRHWKVLPFRVEERNLFLASPEPHATATAEALRSFTALEIRFHLVTPTEFARLTSALL